ncbi:Bug family tripartite tricarboxylate transporter substrate binding protein [Bacillus sp. FJAT-44742]|uniref:Bug family tripartite tricarboxylate transporter substrate binding protein n=1 Tax=Bacillus sp. FJAT-44742 TaxID=2014005 RepID=UPI000C236470|nr:tripartite tricarboxylate transporter substrate binding protein [Bacillus sp. FJAT-44742]
MERKCWAKVTGLLTAGVLLLSACGGTQEGSSEETSASSWPDEELTMIVPFGAGGSADRQARALATYLGEELDTSVVVENREGGGGAVGTTSHKQSDPSDGTYFIYQSHPHFEASIVREADYEFEDFDYLGLTHESPITIWVDESSEYETLDDLLTEVENNPGGLSYAMISASWSDIAVKMVMDELGLDVRAVPYDGGGDMRTALMGGEVDFIASDVEGTLAGAGEDLRPLAIFSDEPYEHAEDIPLINQELEDMGHDTDLPGVSNMRFIQVKSEFKEEYPERYELLEEALEASVTNEEFIEWGQDQDMYLSWTGSDETRNQLSETIDVIYEYEELFQ